MGNVGKTVGMMGKEPSPATQKDITASYTQYEVVTDDKCRDL